MKASYKKIMDLLGVGRQLNVYETQPWLMYDDEKALTCEAEVRCNQDKSEIEAELQFMYDKLKEGQLPVEQICLIKVKRQVSLNNQYVVTSCLINGTERKGAFYDWETQSCNFFRSCVREIKADKVPDIEAIEKREMKESGGYGGNQGDGSNKSPKINAGQLMYDRKGIGAGF